MAYTAAGLRTSYAKVARACEIFYRKLAEKPTPLSPTVTGVFLNSLSIRKNAGLQMWRLDTHLLKQEKQVTSQCLVSFYGNSGCMPG